MTTAMQKAINMAKAQGGYIIAGHSVSAKGSTVRVSASTLRALAKRGVMTLHIGPDGGMMGRLV